jgi:hypothetical protein
MHVPKIRQCRDQAWPTKRAKGTGSEYPQLALSDDRRRGFKEAHAESGHFRNIQIAHDEARGLFLDRPARREAVFGHGLKDQLVGHNKYHGRK